MEKILKDMADSKSPLYLGEGSKVLETIEGSDGSLKIRYEVGEALGVLFAPMETIEIKFENIDSNNGARNPNSILPQCWVAPYSNEMKMPFPNLTLYPGVQDNTLVMKQWPYVPGYPSTVDVKYNARK